MKIGILARALAVSIIMTGTANAAPKYEISDGKLTAIRGIYGSFGAWSTTPIFTLRGNDTYERLSDIEFGDGTCTDVFGKCASMDSFSASGRAAADPLPALLTNGVMVGGNSYDFSSNPALISGCESNVSCAIIAGRRLTDTSEKVGAFKFIINASGADYKEGVPSWAIGTDTKKLSDTTFGRYKSYESLIAAVPEPSTWAMMLTGFGMIGGAARYRRKARTVSLA